MFKAVTPSVYNEEENTMHRNDGEKGEQNGGQNDHFFLKRFPSIPMCAIKELGRGNFGVVTAAAPLHLARRKTDERIKHEELVAIKWVPFSLSSSQSITTTLRELNILLHSVQKGIFYFHVAPTTCFQSRDAPQRTMEREVTRKETWSDPSYKNSSSRKEVNEEEERKCDERRMMPKNSLSRSSLSFSTRNSQRMVNQYPLLCCVTPLFRGSSHTVRRNYCRGTPLTFNSEETTCTAGMNSSFTGTDPSPSLDYFTSALPLSWTSVGLQYGRDDALWWNHLTGHPNIIRLYGFHYPNITPSDRCSFDQCSEEGLNENRNYYSSPRLRTDEKEKKLGVPTDRRATSSCSSHSFLPPALYLMMEMMPTDLHRFRLQHFSRDIVKKNKKTAARPTPSTPVPSASGATSTKTMTDGDARNGDDIYSSLNSFTPSLPILYVKLILFQIARALCFLHSYDICHRDLKPQNILLNEETGEVKLCDLGSAKCIPPPVPPSLSSSPISSSSEKLASPQRNTAYVCSRFYRAPELLLGSMIYGFAVDIWSFGCIVAELLHLHFCTTSSSAEFCRRRKRLGEPFFQGHTTADQLVQIMKVLGTPSKAAFMEMNPSYLLAMQHVFGVQRLDSYSLPTSSYYLYTSSFSSTAHPYTPKDAYGDERKDTRELGRAYSSSKSPSSEEHARRNTNRTSCTDSSSFPAFFSHFRILPKRWSEVLFKGHHKREGENLKQTKQQSENQRSGVATDGKRKVSFPSSDNVPNTTATEVNEPHHRKPYSERWSPYLSADAEDLLCRTLCYAPSQRLTAADIVQHPFFDELFSSTADARKGSIYGSKIMTTAACSTSSVKCSSRDESNMNASHSNPTSLFSPSSPILPRLLPFLWKETDKWNVDNRHNSHTTNNLNAPHTEENCIFSSSPTPFSSSPENKEKVKMRCLPVSLFMLTPEESRLYSTEFKEKMYQEVERIRKYVNT